MCPVIAAKDARELRRALSGQRTQQSAQQPAQRVIALWLPDWPVQAAWISGAVRERAQLMGSSAGAAAGSVGSTSRNMVYAASMVPIALFGAMGVVDCSNAARRAGVRRGQSRRRAQAACPELITIDEDPARDAQEFESVLERVESVAAGVEALRPGLIVVNGYAPTRYYGSEERAMELLLDATALPGVDCNVGVADDIVTAILAARRGVAIPSGGGRKFRCQVSLAEVAAEAALDFPGHLKESWLELGLHTLGDVVRIPARDMATRFGMEGARWRGIAEGGAVELVSPREVPADLSVSHAPEEPLSRVDVAAFVARMLAAQLHEKLRNHGLSCYRLAVSAVFDDQQELRRVWRCAGPLDEAMTADRVRWQLDGWLHRRKVNRQVGQLSARRSSARHDSDLPPETSIGVDSLYDGGLHDDDAQGDSSRGIIELRLEPLDVVVAGVVRDALWGGADDAAERALRAATRVQGVLGIEAVTRPVLAGGRGPGERVAKVPVGEQATPDTSRWAGVIPAPNPAMRHPAASVQLVDMEGESVLVTGRATLRRPPAFLVWGSKRLEVTSWAGPWPVDERWWDTENAHRAARLQIVVARTSEGASGSVFTHASECSSDYPGEGTSERTGNKTGVEAFLLIGQKGKWRIEGRYA